MAAYTGYFQKDDIIAESKEDGDKTIVCKVYFNGLYYTCPDPKDLHSCESIHDAYLNGMHITVDEYEISEESYIRLRYGSS